MNSRSLVCRADPGGHWRRDEWVYNAADINTASVIWARDLGDEGNRELLRYFRARKIWLVEPDQRVPGVVPYQ